MGNQVMILCDTEEEYAQGITEYFLRQRDFPWTLHTYTDVNAMMEAEAQSESAMLVVSENAFSKEILKLKTLKCVILNETGIVKWEQIPQINKYQAAEHVLKRLLEQYVEVAEEPVILKSVRVKTSFIGMYSPVRRSLQSTFAMSMAMLLAEEHKTLYLNFEHFAGIPELMADIQTKDLSDLMYFLGAGGEKFRLRFHAMLQQKGALDVIPPMRMGQNLLSITSGEWINLLLKLEEMGEYEYVILDLSESIQGLFDILRLCRQVYTLSREDRISMAKMNQYEQLLSQTEYGDVLEKTSRLNLPKFRRLPEQLEFYSKGDLADYVKKQIEQLRNGWGKNDRQVFES